MEYYQKLKELRIDHDFTQEQISKFLKIDQSYYSKYEHGKRPLPISHLSSLCLLYKVSADYILGLPRGLSWPRNK
jgi:transcriptional regulator with XRE-family HTH domain